MQELELEPGGRQHAVDVLRPAQAGLRPVRPAARVVDLDLGPVPGRAEHAHAVVAAGQQPVRVQQLQRHPAGRVARGRGQALGPVQDLRGTHHQGERPVQPEILDPGLDQLHAGQPGAQVAQHGRVRVHAHQLDPGPGQGHGQAARPDAQVEHGAPGRPAPVQPGLRVGGVLQGGVELGEPGIGVLGVVADQASHRGSVHSP